MNKLDLPAAAPLIATWQKSELHEIWTRIGDPQPVHSAELTTFERLTFSLRSILTAVRHAATVISLLQARSDAVAQRHGRIWELQIKMKCLDALEGIERAQGHAGGFASLPGLAMFAELMATTRREIRSMREESESMAFTGSMSHTPALGSPTADPMALKETFNKLESGQSAGLFASARESRSMLGDTAQLLEAVIKALMETTQTLEEGWTRYQEQRRDQIQRAMQSLHQMLAETEMVLGRTSASDRPG